MHKESDEIYPTRYFRALKKRQVKFLNFLKITREGSSG